MEVVEIVGAFFGVILLVGLCVLYGFFIYWAAKFLSSTPGFLERIAIALEKIANKK